MLRVGIIVLICVIGCTYATAQDAEQVFVPHISLTEQEMDDYKAELITDYGWSESTAEEFVRGADREHYRFTDHDFRRAFPGILPDDKQASVCGNSMMSGATKLVYLSPALDNKVTVKTSGCSPIEGGLSCSPLSEDERYYFETPEQNFTLDDDVTFDEASDLLAIFRDHGISGLPDWYQRQRFGYLDVANIGKTGDVYVLRLGEFFCRGCTATFKVKVEKSDGEKPHLILVEEPEGMSI